MSIERIVQIHDKLITDILMNSEANYTSILGDLVTLCNQVNKYYIFCQDNNLETENIWYIGGATECCLSELLVGAYWHLSEWHEGHASLSYEALSALGSIYTPNMEIGPEEDTSEHYIYQRLETMINKSTTS